MSTDKSAPVSSRPPDKSVLGQFSFVLLVAWIVSVALTEWDGYREGRAQVMQTLEKKQQALVTDMMERNTTTTMKGFSCVHHLKNRLRQVMQEIAAKLSLPFSSVNPERLRFSESQKKWGNDIRDTASGFIVIFIQTTKEFFLKLAALLLSTGCMMAAAVVGAMDGFVSRAVRRAEGGRESTWLFHQLSRHVGQLTCVILAAYFIWGKVLTPERTVLLLSLTVGVFCRISTSQLKKYW